MSSYIETGSMGMKKPGVEVLAETDGCLTGLRSPTENRSHGKQDDNGTAHSSVARRPAIKRSTRGGRDGVTSYLRSISSCSLLSAERERELAQIICDGISRLMQLVEQHASKDPVLEDLQQKIKQLKRQEESFPGVRDKIIKVINRVLDRCSRDQPLHPLYTAMHREIGEIMTVVDQAKQEMVRGNLRLVLSIAKRFRGRGLSFEDLVQEGNLGLIKAVVRYDHTKGNRFSTYATWWVRQSIIRGIYDKSRTIRLPVHCIEQKNRFSKISNELLIEFGRDPTLYEIAERTDICIEKVRMILIHTTQHLSLETPIGDEDQRLGDLLVDDSSCSPMSEYDQKELQEVVSQALSRLQPREEKILRMRFGIGRYHPQTLEAIGNHFQVSKERIRQIEKKALTKLRAPVHSGQMEEMWQYD